MVKNIAPNIRVSYLKKNNFPNAKIFSNFTIHHLPLQRVKSANLAYKFQPSQPLPREKSVFIPRISK